MVDRIWEGISDRVGVPSSRIFEDAGSRRSDHDIDDGDLDVVSGPGCDQ
jgi:hypothetical protein